MERDFPDPLRVLEVTIDIDNYIAGRSTTLTSVRELVELLKTYQLSDTNKMNAYLFEKFYNPLWKAMIKNSDKNEIKNIPELALEMQLLTSELDNVDKNSNTERLKTIISPFLSDYTRELIAFSSEQNLRRYVV